MQGCVCVSRELEFEKRDVELKIYLVEKKNVRAWANAEKQKGK